MLVLGALFALYLRRRRQSIRKEHLFTRGERPVIDEPAVVEPFMPTDPTCQFFPRPLEVRSLPSRIAPASDSIGHPAPVPPQPELLISSGSHPIPQRSPVPIAATSEKGTRPTVISADTTLQPSLDASSPPMAERHVDAGPVPMLSRSESGRLPPAYGEQQD